MEFRFNIGEVFKHPIVEINQNMIPPGYTGDRRALWDVVSKVGEVVNEMGAASAAAQGLTKPITTADRLRNSEHKLYFLVDHQANNGKGAITGMLKTGNKSLYVFDRDGNHYQVSPPCLLDFYIHESRQRNGLGKVLFEHMLEKEKIDPVQMAIDRPSEKLLNFLHKHYNLREPVKQMNNYVVFDEFFPRRALTPAQPDKQAAGLRSKTSINPNAANGLQAQEPSGYGRYSAPRRPCSMGQIIHNQSPNHQRQDPSGTQSMPATNYQVDQHQANSINPNFVNQSTPNLYYGTQHTPALSPNSFNQYQSLPQGQFQPPYQTMLGQNWQQNSYQNPQSYPPQGTNSAYQISPSNMTHQTQDMTQFIPQSGNYVASQLPHSYPVQIDPSQQTVNAAFTNSTPVSQTNASYQYQQNPDIYAAQMAAARQQAQQAANLATQVPNMTGPQTTNIPSQEQASNILSQQAATMAAQQAQATNMASEQYETSNTVAQQHAAYIAAHQHAANIAAQQQADNIAAQQQGANMTAQQQAANLAAQQQAAIMGAQQQAANMAAQQQAANMSAQQQAANMSAQQQAANMAAQQQAASMATQQQSAEMIAQQQAAGMSAQQDNLTPQQQAANVAAQQQSASLAAQQQAASLAAQQQAASYAAQQQAASLAAQQQAASYAAQQQAASLAAQQPQANFVSQQQAAQIVAQQQVNQMAANQQAANLAAQHAANLGAAQQAANMVAAAQQALNMAQQAQSANMTGQQYGQNQMEGLIPPYAQSQALSPPLKPQYTTLMPSIPAEQNYPAQSIRSAPLHPSTPVTNLATSQAQSMPRIANQSQPVNNFGRNQANHQNSSQIAELMQSFEQTPSSKEQQQRPLSASQTPQAVSQYTTPVISKQDIPIQHSLPPQPVQNYAGPNLSNQMQNQQYLRNIQNAMQAGDYSIAQHQMNEQNKLHENQVNERGDRPYSASEFCAADIFRVTQKQRVKNDGSELKTNDNELKNGYPPQVTHSSIMTRPIPIRSQYS